MTLNNIKSHLIYPGQQINTTPLPNNRIIYTVKAGETACTLSLLRYNVNIDGIKKANNLKIRILFM